MSAQLPLQVPMPVPDGDTQVFWEGVLQGELLIQRCEDCRQHIFYPRSICPHCFSEDVAWVNAQGTGRIYSYTVVHQAFGPFSEQTPFVVAIVELQEGVRMMTRIVTDDPYAVTIDAPVQVTFERINDDLTLPYFALL